MIRYENGSKDVFNETNSTSTEKQQPTTITPIQPNLSYRNGVWQNNAKIKPDQVREIMNENSEALRYYNNGRSLYIVGQVIAYPCSFLLGWELGKLIVGNENNMVLLGIGVAGTAAGLIMAYSGENKIKTSVRLYNSKANNAVSYQINFGFTQTGVGLCIGFK